MKTILLFTCLLSSSLLHAGVQTVTIDQRQHQQAHRIVAGVNNGSLTVRETHRLARQQIHIRKLERNFKSDGHLSRAERLTLQRKQNRASSHIYRQKHDRQYR